MNIHGIGLISMAGGYANAVAGYVSRQCQSATTYERCIELLSNNTRTLNTLAAAPDFIRGCLGAVTGCLVVDMVTTLYNISSADLCLADKVRPTLKATVLLVVSGYITVQMFS